MVIWASFYHIALKQYITYKTNTHNIFKLSTESDESSSGYEK